MARGGAAAAAIVLLAAACSSGHALPTTSKRAAATVPSTTTPSPTLPSVTRPVATTVAATTTTIDPGALPQTSQLPSATDPAFLARIGLLWQAVVAGSPALAHPAFFPLSAYVQVKDISDPVHDYDTRLIADFDQDITALHGEMPPGATFASVSVPDAGEWIRPGVEDNKGSYWRVYGTRVLYNAGGVTRSFPIASMISWRGEWYVVHFSAIR